MSRLDLPHLRMPVIDETGIVVERTELGQIVLSAIGAHVVLLVTF